MSISIEDILRGHGIGSGNGLQIVKSATEPTAGLHEGLLWYEPTSGSAKIYLDGQFRAMGGGGGGVVITSITGYTKTTTVTNEVLIPTMNASVPALNYNPSTDILLVVQNGSAITEGVDFTIDKVYGKIKKITGNWNTDTSFGFTALIPTTLQEETGLSTVQIEDHVTVASGVTQVAFSIPLFNPVHDLLEVHQRNLKIFKNVDWTLHASGAAILLNYVLDKADEFHFTVTKKIRDAALDDAIMMNDHVAAAMPHQFIVGGKAHKYGWKVENGELKFVYEEVV